MCVFVCCAAATLYMAVTLVVSGMYDCTVTSQQSAPLSFVFEKTHLTWATYIINVVCVTRDARAAGAGFMLHRPDVLVGKVRCSQYFVSPILEPFLLLVGLHYRALSLA